MPPAQVKRRSAGNAATVRLNADERREKLLRAARKLFTRNGYDATKMDEIAEAAHCTTGPLYYFFKSKRDIFEAALRQSIDSARGHAVERRAMLNNAPALQRLHASCDYVLDLLAIPETVMFIREAPRVLGHDLWQKLRDTMMLRSFESDLRDAMISGEVPPEPPAPLAAILWAATIEAINHGADDQQGQIVQFRKTLHRMIERLRFAPDSV